MTDFIAEAHKVIQRAFPVGDAAELEQFARRLEAQADALGRCGSQLRHVIGGGGLYSGELAERVKRHSEELSAGLINSDAQEARAIAAEVRAQARHLSDSQMAWKQDIKRIAARLEAEFERTVGND